MSLGDGKKKAVMKKKKLARSLARAPNALAGGWVRGGGGLGPGLVPSALALGHGLLGDPPRGPRGPRSGRGLRSFGGRLLGLVAIQGGLRRRGGCTRGGQRGLGGLRTYCWRGHGLRRGNAAVVTLGWDLVGRHKYVFVTVSTF